MVAESSPSSPPRAILFDLGGTVLVESRIDLRDATEWLVRDSAGISVEQVRSLYNDVRNSFRSGVVEFRMQSFLRLVRDWGRLPFQGTIEELELEFWKRLCSMGPLPGVEAVLKELKTRGLIVGIVSNSVFSEDVLTYELRRNHLQDYFQVVVSSAEYGLQKPHPAIFAAAIGRSGVKATEAWFVGDNYQKDILGAAAAGLRPIWLNAESASVELPPECLRIAGWNELLPLIDGANAKYHA